MLEQLLYLFGVVDETFIVLLYCIYKVDRMGSPQANMATLPGLMAVINSLHLSRLLLFFFTFLFRDLFREGALI